MYSLGEKLKKLRIEKKLSQDKLCDSLNKKYNTNINKGMISKWENNREEPRMEFMRNFALFFKVSLDYLIGINTVAAHHQGECFTEEEIQAIEDYKQFILSKRKK